MLNISNIDLRINYASAEEEIRAMKSYIYQLVNELDFRLQDRPDEQAEAQIQQVIIRQSGGGGGGDITVDSALSTSSTNPVQNKVITGALGDKEDAMDRITNTELEEILT